MCREFTDEEELLEFHLAERFTFLEYRPVTAEIPLTLQKCKSAPQLLCLEAFAQEEKEADVRHVDSDAGDCVVCHRSLGTLSTCTSQGADSGSEPEQPDFDCREVGPQWSVGAALHSQGDCKPCAWFWRPQGCTRGEACQHCHLCPPGALQRNKRRNRQLLKALKQKAREVSHTVRPLPQEMFIVWPLHQVMPGVANESPQPCRYV
eukprot:Skav224555  [mRNA]  locus=scaffold2085:88776:89393:+ [translate_table: standard]